MIDVLLVDDEDGILEVTQTYLESDGDIFAKTASSALEAIKTLSNWDYDLIISDHAMPGGSGLDLLKALRRRGNNIPFIFFTAKDRDELEAEALECGACYFVEKGANLKGKLPDLKRTVRETVRRNRAQIPGRPREEHIKSILDTYVHDDLDPDLEASFEVFEDPIPNWMKGREPAEADDAGDVFERPQYLTMSMLTNIPAMRLRKGAVALPKHESIPPQDKSRLASNGSGARFGGGLKLLRENVGLREADELITIENEPRYDRWTS